MGYEAKYRQTIHSDFPCISKGRESLGKLFRTLCHFLTLSVITIEKINNWGILVSDVSKDAMGQLGYISDDATFLV